MYNNCFVKSLLIVIIAIVLSIVLVLVFHQPAQHNAYIEDAALHLRLTSREVTDEGQTRMYFSRTDTFGSDYIQFTSTECQIPKIYYMHPDTIYIIDKGGDLVTDIQSKQFYIKYVKPPFLLNNDIRTYNRNLGYILNRMDAFQQEISTIVDRRTLTIQIVDWARGFIVFDNRGNIIFEDY